MKESGNAKPTIVSPAKIIYWCIFGLALMFAGYLYLFIFNECSETELVQYSFIWMSMGAFAAGGMTFINKGLGRSLLYATAFGTTAISVLEVFYYTIWPSL